MDVMKVISSSCRAYCSEEGYEYFGVQFGFQCFCGDEPPEDAELAEDPEQCDKTCPGDSKKMCGGTWRMNVFRVGDDQED